MIKIPLKPTGKKYNLNGKEIVLYPVAKLVEELEKCGHPRDSQTIRKWEKLGVTPPAKFRHRDKRLYSIEQINAFCEVAVECNIRQGFSIGMTDFSEKIHERLEEVNSKLLS